VIRRRRKVAFAAGREMPELDDGWPLLRDAVAAVGLEPAVAVWEDPGVDWAVFDLVVVMYTWGYVVRRDEFLAWAATAARDTQLVNAEPVLRWNSDKTYLADLGAAGIPTVPTAWVPPGAAWHPPGPDYVVKPTVASGGIDAARYVTQGVEAAERHIDRLHEQGRTAMVQPYLPTVDTEGETALIFFGDRFSHAIAKQGLLEADVGPIFGLWERQVISPRTARPDQHGLAERALRVVHERLGRTAYARVDLVDGDDGRPVVIELELIEPSLFLDLAPAGAPRLADELRERVAR
jgi:glutathione synthase/RimK-type ligase-like ATP-grasp enzyme